MSGPELHVSGGAGGTDAHVEDIATLARTSDDLALSLGSISAECHAMLADPDLLASAVLDPGGVARFEKTLLAALDGRGGLTALSVGFGQRGIALRVVAASYQAVDEAQAQAIDSIRWAAGHAFAETMPVSLVALAGSLGAPLAAYTLLGGELDYQRLITDHPGIVDNLVGAGPGLLSGLPGLFAVDVPGAAHLVGMFYPDGTPMVADAGVDTMHPSMTKPPGGFGDLMAGLDYRNGSAHPGQPDQIDVRVITHADGSKAYIVDIPGTKVWDLPGSHHDALNDLGTNVHVMGGDLTTREKAIADALHRAGASPADPVMLVGHSQGGMVAAQAAQDTANGGFGYHVTHVITAGSPVARYDIPDTVQMLSIENQHDIVAHLDAADNPDRPNRTTVTFDSQYGTIGNNHATDKAYLPAAQSLDTSTDPSVTAYRNSAGAFLSTTADGTTVQANVYNMTRKP